MNMIKLKFFELFQLKLDLSKYVNELNPSLRINWNTGFIWVFNFRLIIDDKSKQHS